MLDSKINLTIFYKKIFFISFLISFCILLIYYKENGKIIIINSIFFTTSTPEVLEDFTVKKSESEYLVSSNKCKIPNIEPFNSLTKRFYHPEKYKKCSKLKLLTYITKNENNSIATLHIDNNLIPSYSINGVNCCYSNIVRKVKYNFPDDNIDISDCIHFENNITLSKSNEIILVKCKDAKNKKKLIYENTHLIIKINNKLITQKTNDNNQNNKNLLNILLIGIDSISRLNLIRSMPKTYEYLRNQTNWLPLNGYNKINDNTFPNLMAILTGFNQTYAYSKCNPKEIGKLDQCPIIWKDFKRFNYITSYGEDEVWINTFNYKKKGFSKPPTDYYLRPYMMVSETRLRFLKKDDMTYCTGPETSGERILNAAKDLAITYQNYSTFGLFWMNTFSHNKINSPTGMDLKILEFLQNLDSNGILNNTILIFLSDHGIRFGEIRYSQVGWLEERLPFIYVSFPKWFETKFPNEYQNFKNNSNKLTTPYDLHLTLQHILQLSLPDDKNNTYKIKSSNACPKCQSLFEEIDSERSCEDASIEQHWCTCSGYKVIDPKNETVLNAMKFTLNQIQEIINKSSENIDNKMNCAKFKLKKIISASISQVFDYKNDIYLLIVFETKPKAVFETTVLINNQNFSLVGGISRLDYYSQHSRCVNDSYLKMYCYCRY